MVFKRDDTIEAVDSVVDWTENGKSTRRQILIVFSLDVQSVFWLETDFLYAVKTLFAKNGSTILKREEVKGMVR